MTTFHLYSWGANSHGQLGLGDISEGEVLQPREVNLSHVGLVPCEIVKIVGGAGHTLLLDSNGRVYSCGRMGGLATAGSTFKRIEELAHERVVDLACGWDWSLVLTEDGRVFVWGSNAFGQLGLPGVATVNKPTELDTKMRIKRIAAGLRHSALVTASSELLVSGANNKGQLGITDALGSKRVDVFTHVPDLQVEEVACGQHHTVVITKNKDIYSWGDNKHGQLGFVLPSDLKLIHIPNNIKDFVNMGSPCKVYCGWTHTTILTEEKKVCSWGRNTYGQLGREKMTPSHTCWKPAQVNYLPPVKELSVGSEHTVALAECTGAYSWGWNEHGNCGTGGIEDTFRPTKVLLPQGHVVRVGTGAGHSFAVVET